MNLQPYSSGVYHIYVEFSKTTISFLNRVRKIFVHSAGYPIRYAWQFSFHLPTDLLLRLPINGQQKNIYIKNIKEASKIREK